MAIKRYKPTSSARRFMSVSTFEEITCTKPERSLLEDKRHTGGRNANGRITVRHHGGGNKTKYRIIDFKRNKDGIPAIVKTIEYDPNRTANIALLQYVDGEKRYILAPIGLTVGDKVLSGPGADIKAGNALKIEDIPVGTMINNIELYPRQSGAYRKCYRHQHQLYKAPYNVFEVRNGMLLGIVAHDDATDSGNAHTQQHDTQHASDEHESRHLSPMLYIEGLIYNNE